MEQEKQSKEDNQQSNDDKDKEKELKTAKTENDSNPEPVKSEEPSVKENVVELNAETVKVKQELEEDKKASEEKEDKKSASEEISTPSNEQSIASKTIDSDKPVAHESPGTANTAEPTKEQVKIENTDTSASSEETKVQIKDEISDNLGEKCDVNENSDVTSTSSSSSATPSTSSQNRQNSSNSNGGTSNGNNNKKYSSFKDIEEDLDGDSLMTKVILYSLQNKLTVDNSRLDMAKNKYMMTNKNNSNSSSNNNSNFNSNSNSNSNSSSDAAISPKASSAPQQLQTDTEQVANEFKGGGSPVASTSASTTTSTELNNNTASDNSDKGNTKDNELISNGADNNKLVSDSTGNVATSSSTIEKDVIKLGDKPTESEELTTKRLSSDENQENTVSTNKISVENQNESLEGAGSSSKPHNDNLDFRESAAKPSSASEEPATLDLTVPSREKSYDDKSVPPIKRKNVLYVGIPDFSKPIFTAPTITKTTNSTTDQAPKNENSPLVVPKMKTPDFSNATRPTSELQMRQPDFSNCFSKDSKTDDSNRNAAKIPVNESDLAELRLRNNYVSDLQLKPPSTATSTGAPSTSYKIDYKPPTQNFVAGEKSSEPRDSQQFFEEPTAHIIHKQKFLPTNSIEKAETNSTSQKAAIWTPHLLGGSLQSVELAKPKINHPGTPYENPHNSQKDVNNRYPGPNPNYPVPGHNPYLPDNKTPSIPPQKKYPEETVSSQPQPSQANAQYPPHSSNEDLRKYNPAHYPYMHKDKQYIRSIEMQERQRQEFSLKQKEHQLRQEGTIITVKKDAAPPVPPKLPPVLNNEYSKTSEPSRIPKEPPDLYRDYKLKQGNHEYVPSKDLSSSSKIQHTSSTSSSNLSKVSNNSASASAPYSHMNSEYPHAPYSHPQIPRQPEYRYDPLKSSGAFKRVEHTKSPVTAMYPPPNDGRQIRHIGNTSVSPVMHAHMTPSENYASSSSSRSYGSPSPIHHYHQQPPTQPPHHLQHPHGRSPIPQSKHEGQMNPPLHWPPHLQPNRSSVGSPVDRQIQPNLMTSPSPTNVLHSSPKPRTSPSPIQSPVHHMKSSTSPHALPNHYPMAPSHQKYPNNYPAKVENKDYYGKGPSAVPPNNMPAYSLKYPESRLINHESFSRQFETDQRKYLNPELSKYQNPEIPGSQENLSRLKEVSNRYGSPSGEYSGIRHSSSETNLNQMQQRHHQFPEHDMRKSGPDLRDSRDPYRNHNPDISRHRSMEPMSYPENAYRQNIPPNQARPSDQRSIPSASSSSNLKNLNALEIRPIDPRGMYPAHPSNSTNYDRRPANDLATISKVKVEPKPGPVERSAPPPASREPQSSIIKNPISVLGPVKRESPLDLSVKTIKTKADSTGCDDYAVASSSRSRTEHKVEFMPNFAQHSDRRDYSNRHPHPPPPTQQQHSHPPSQQIPNDTTHRIHNIVNSERSNVVQSQHNIPHPVSTRPPSNIHMDNSRREEYYRGMPSTSHPHPDRNNQNLYPPKDGYPPRPIVYDNRQIPDNRMRSHPPMPSQSVPSRDKPYHHEMNHIVPPGTEHHRPTISGHYPDNSKNMHPYKPNLVGDPHHPLPHNANIPPSLEIRKSSSKYDLESERKLDRNLVESILYSRKTAAAQAAQQQQQQQHPYPPTHPNNYDRKRSSDPIPSHVPPPPKQVKVEDNPRYENSYPPNLYPPGTDPRGYSGRNEGPVPGNHKPVQYPPHHPHQYMPQEHPNARAAAGYPHPPKSIAESKYYADPRYPVKDHNLVKPHMNTPPPVAFREYQSGTQAPAFQGPQYYPNPKAEMIRREDPTANINYKYLTNSPQHQLPQVAMPEKLPYPQQNFYPRPDDVHLKREQIPPTPSTAYNSKYPQYTAPKLVKQQTVINENVIKVDQISGQITGEQRSSTNLTSSSNMGSNGSISRGADQSTISKLRNSLNMKEKLKNQKSIEISEDENNKTDTSPRQFRTKGELKGFNPVPAAPVENQKPSTSVVVDNRRKFDEPINLHKEVVVNRMNEETSSAFDIMDWGSACNDFVEQLQTGKKRGKRKRVGKNVNDNEFKIEVVDKPVTFSDLPGISADISEVPIDIVKSMNKEVKETCSSEEIPLERYRNSSNNNSQDSTYSSRSARDIRQKQRKAREKTHMAKLGDPSSSENETESKRESRSKIKVPRVRTRSSLKILKTDDSSVDEESDDDETLKKKAMNLKRKKQEMETSESEPINVKKKINKAILKLEEMTSSESENEQSKKKSDTKTTDNSKNSEKKASGDQNNKKSKDDQDPKAATNKSPNKSNKKPTKSESNNNKNKQNTSSSESEGSEEEQKSSKQDKKSKTTSKAATAAATTTTSAKKSKTVEEESSDDVKKKKEEVTMTRSKRKLEIEKKLSNSKVLRNDKIVQNISPDRKAKHAAEAAVSKKGAGTVAQVQGKKKEKSDESKRKILDSESDESGKAKPKNRRVSKLSSSSEEESEQETVAERLRPRKCKTEAAENSATKTKDKDKEKEKDKDKKEKDEKEKEKEKKTKTNAKNQEPKNEGASTSQPSLTCKIPLFSFFREDKANKFTPGWEIETYNYKKSLKVPLPLITIGRPPLHGVSHSLPDLDHQSSDASDSFFESRRKIIAMGENKLNKKVTPIKKDAEQEPQHTPGKRTMIEILHQRMMQQKKLKNKKHGNSKLVKSTPTKKEDEECSEVVKKNIFETCILKSRTRTESKTMKTKESLREVFGVDGGDRPSSAPPFIFEEEKMNFEQRVSKINEEMNRFLGEPAKMIFPVKNESKNNSTTATPIKAEKIDEDSNLNPDDEDDDNETVRSMLTDTKEEHGERDLVTPTPLSKIKVKKGRGIRTGRRKGSSGFDYIRKKKKPTPQNNSENNPAANIIKKRMAAMENLQEKDENDIGKEIKGWVLNKGVGESAMHKASRLGYIDVIAYCLERLGMGPDPKDNAGYTPLHEACSKGHLDIAQLLLQFGANHSETALSGIRPLHEAVENGHVEIVRLLLAYGADPGLSTYAGQTPIMLAENEDMTSFLRAYLNDLDSNHFSKTKWSFQGPWKRYDTEEHGYDIFEDAPPEVTESNVSSMISTFSTSTTSLITATTQMSDNETVTSETVTPIKAPTPISKAMDNKFSTPLNNNIDIATNLVASKFPHKMKKCDTNSNNIVMTNKMTDKDTKCDKLNNNEGNKGNKKMKSCTVVLNHIDSSITAKKNAKKMPQLTKQDSINEISSLDGNQKMEKDDFDEPETEHLDESDGEIFEFEESDSPLPPLYLLKDEGTEKWILLSDLCNLLKVKSKDAVLKQICPSSPPNSVKKEILRELEMADFLKKAVCLQLFCAGEKLNIRSSKVILVRYNDSVRNLLGVQTFMMNI